MSKLTLGPKQYKCSCKQIQTHYVWSDKIDTATHDCINPKCDKQVGPSQLYKPKKKSLIGIRTDTKNRV